ncbi:MAG: hypothetical protein WDW38_002392 [Sanguina aurantia]
MTLPLPLQASSEKSEEDCCDNALTDNRDETWHSGKQAPAWINLDLGRPRQLSHVRLLPFQVPTSGQSRHKVYVGNNLGDMKLAAEVSTETHHHKWMQDVTLAAAQDARYIRIETVEHPGWVAWSGIQLFAAPE